MSSFLASRSQLRSWTRAVAGRCELIGPRREGLSNWNYGPLADGEELLPEGYRPSVVPPGRLMAPDQEVLFEFRRDAEGGIEFVPAAAKGERILFGVRPCDLRAIAQMDAVHAEPPADPHYAANRARTQVIGVDCLRPCDERAFCAATGSLQQREGADLFLTPSDDGYLVEALTEAGRTLAAEAGWPACPDAAARRERAEASRPQPFGRALGAAPEALPEILRRSYDSPVWAEYAERCFSCGTCNLVCPTCYCFEVCDELALDGRSGARLRTWDGCMVPDFAVVAGGHNFRPGCTERQRHRVKRKFEYLTERHGLGSFCVGCGRCGRQCTTGIDILDMVNAIVAAEVPA